MSRGVPNAAAIDGAVAGREGDLITLRRDIHRWPELAGAERRTAALVAERLAAAGLTVWRGVGGHGVVALLEGAAGGPTVAYRAELDAVPGRELFAGDFASQVPGAAHICGHDLHAAIGIGVAEVLARLRPDGRVLFVFQPAEETLEGARAVIDAGVLDWAAPREIYALHCGPAPVGTFLVQPGSGLPGLDRFRVELSGAGAEAAALRLAARASALSTVRFPQTADRLASLLEWLRPSDGPLARFVFVRSAARVGDSGAVVDVSVRACPDDRYAEIREEVRSLADSVGGARLTFPTPVSPGMVCSSDLSEDFAAYVHATQCGHAISLRSAFPFNSDDFALFLRRLPGAMFVLGVAEAGAGLGALPHSPHFAPDERAIGAGVRAMAGFLARRLAELARCAG